MIDLTHHLFIDVQATGGVDDNHVDELELRFLYSSLGDVHRLLAQVGREERHADVVGQGFQLLDRSSYKTRCRPRHCRWSS